jgi:hypothetical protein
MKKTELFLYGLGLLVVGAGLGIFGRPIFGREGHAPELRAAGGKFQPNFGFIPAHRAEKRDITFLFFLGGVVPQHQQAAAGHARLQQNERAVGVDGQGVAFFIEGLALRVDAVDSNAELHQDALTSAAVPCTGRNACRFGH